MVSESEGSSMSMNKNKSALSIETPMEIPSDHVRTPETSLTTRRRTPYKYKLSYIVGLSIILSTALVALAIVFLNGGFSKFLGRHIKDPLSDERTANIIVLKNNLKNPAFNEIYYGMRSAIKDMGINIISGPFDACLTRGWKLNCVNNNEIMGVLEWELNSVANILTSSNDKLSNKEEVETMLAYKMFNNHNGIQYKSMEEYTMRYSNFRKHKRRIDLHNSNENRLYDKGYSWSLEYSDAELGLEMLMSPPSRISYDFMNGEFFPSDNISSAGITGPEDVILKDWREENVVSPVINQGTCGSCWAVAAASLIDSYRAIKSGKLLIHSSKQLLDCTAEKYNCKIGGNHESALKHAAIHGICEETSYPYSPVKNTCNETTCVSRYKIDGIVKLNEKTMEDHIREHGPALVTMKLSRDFMEYRSGIFDGDCVAKVVHSVLIVGFGINKKINHKFWIVKNSWGDDWGHNGYFKLSREPKGEFQNPDTFCHIQNHAFGLKR